MTLDTLPTPAANTAQRGALYTQHDITALGSFSKSHLYNLIARGQFPAPALKMGPRFTRWSANEVEAWLADPKAWIAANTTVLDEAVFVGDPRQIARIKSRVSA